MHFDGGSVLVMTLQGCTKCFKPEVEQSLEISQRRHLALGPKIRWRWMWRMALIFGVIHALEKELDEVLWFFGTKENWLKWGRWFPNVILLEVLGLKKKNVSKGSSINRLILFCKSSLNAYFRIKEIFKLYK